MEVPRPNKFMGEILMSSSALPPLGNLPSWARVSSLDRNRFPKPFLRDRLTTLPPTGPSLPPINSNIKIDHSVSYASQLDLPVQNVDKLSKNEQHRLVYYNKTIKYLQEKHAETLKKLHEEIEMLKQENKDLQFKVVMRKEQNRTSGNSHTSEDRDKIKELRKVVKNSEARNNMLQFALCQFGVKFDPNNKLKPSRSEEVVSVGCKDFSRLLYDPEREDCTELLTPQPTITLPLGATLNPLQVRISEGDPPRAPNVDECDVIIRHLHKSNLEQMEENLRLRSDLRSLLFAKQVMEQRMKSRDQQTTNEEKPKNAPLVNELQMKMLEEAKSQLGSSNPHNISNKSIYEHKKRINSLKRIGCHPRK